MKNLLFSLLALFVFALFSCDKVEDELSTITYDEDAIVANDAAIETVIESTNYEVDLFTGSTASINAVGSDLKSTDHHPLFWNRYRADHLPDVTIETTDGDFPKTITVDYGDSTVLHNGTIISGKIIIVVSAPPCTDGATREVTFEEFYVDSVNIAGLYTITFTSSDDEGITFTATGDLTFTFADGTYVECDIEKIRKFVEGYNTPLDHSDDVIQITGFVSAVSSEGYSFSKTIIEPLVRLGDCRWIVSGTVVIKENDEVIAELNFGDGTCDNIAILIKDGVETEITLGDRCRVMDHDHDHDHNHNN